MAVVRTLIGNVRGPQGEDGSSFEFKKTYATIAAMNSDFSGSDTQTGDYVLIAAASADNADNGKMYRKGNSAWIYVAKISGPTGATGPAGPLCPLDTSMAVTVAGQAALDASLGPTLAGKLDATGDSKDNTVTYTSDDVADGSASTWETVQPLTSGEKHESLFAKLSKVVKNVRFLYKLLGTTDISGIGSGTVTDILSALNSGKFDKANVVNNLTTTTAGYALDAREGKTLADNVSALNDAYTALQSSLATGALDRLDPSRLSVTENLKYTARGSGFRLVAWNPNTINIPEANTWGVCAYFDYYLASGNKWYNNIAFCTDGRIFVAHKRNDETWSDWTKITTTTTL